MPDCVTRLGRVPSLIYFHMYTSIDKESTPQFIRPFDNKDKQSELLYLSTLIYKVIETFRPLALNWTIPCSVELREIYTEFGARDIVSVLSIER